MIHYHGMSGAGSIRDTLQLSTGRHVFVSYADPGRLAAIASTCSSFALDNGAYSAWTRGLEMDYDGFIEFTRKWHRHPAFDWSVIPDVIDGDEDSNDRWLDRWPADLPGVPVWHLHESLGRLERLASMYRVVALGSSGTYRQPGLEGWWRRMGEAMDRICVDGQPICKLHGMRMLDPKIFTQLPLSSADSTNAERNGLFEQSFGAYSPPTRGQRASVIAWRVEHQQSAYRWVPDPQMEMELELEFTQ